MKSEKNFRGPGVRGCLKVKKAVFLQKTAFCIRLKQTFFLILNLISTVCGFRRKILHKVLIGGSPCMGNVPVGRLPRMGNVPIAHPSYTKSVLTIKSARLLRMLLSLQSVRRSLRRLQWREMLSLTAYQALRPQGLPSMLLCQAGEWLPESSGPRTHI